MNQYFQVSDYVSATRSFLHDLIGPPYRYSDDDIINALNVAVGDISRIRPDIFLEYKYQGPLPRASQLNDLVPPLYQATRPNDVVAIPRKFYQPTIFFMSGMLQLYDVDDTQDVRAQAFYGKFLGAFMSLTV
jgi:hypothetical protein